MSLQEYCVRARFGVRDIKTFITAEVSSCRTWPVKKTEWDHIIWIMGGFRKTVEDFVIFGGLVIVLVS